MTNKAKSTAAALALVAALGLGASSAAHAGHDDVDIFWSVAMSQPGLHVGVSNAPRPPVVVYEPRHVHVHPQPVYVPPPRVVYLPPQPVYRVPPGYYGHGHWKDRHDRWEDRHERRERWEDRRERHGGYDRYERDDRRGGYDRYAQRAPNLGNGGQPRAGGPQMGR